MPHLRLGILADLLSRHCDGLGDRLRQTSSGATTTYILDLAGDLTQVLGDGTNRFVYGQGRVVQRTGASSSYFLDDALGSVRQMVDLSGLVNLVRDYEPFGTVKNTTGGGVTPHGFTGEWTDASGLVYFPSPYYA